MEIFLQNVIPIVSTIVTCFIGYLFKEFKKSVDERKTEEAERIAELKKHNKAISKAVKNLCGFRIVQSYQYYLRVGGITIQELDTVTKIYEAYRDLDGNGAVEAVYLKIKLLPLIEESDKKWKTGTQTNLSESD